MIDDDSAYIAAYTDHSTLCALCGRPDQGEPGDCECWTCASCSCLLAWDDTRYYPYCSTHCAISAEED